ncbi:MAG: DUF2934 domain-containing protein [Sideroxydans sp.]|jgi:hypothetical protein
MATTKKAASTSKANTKASTTKTTTVAKKTAPAAKPKTVAKAATPKVPAAKVGTATRKPATASAKSAAPSAEQRYHMVQDAAYYLAEKNGFKGGAIDYWVAAEAEITIFLSGK